MYIIDCETNRSNGSTVEYGIQEGAWCACREREEARIGGTIQGDELWWLKKKDEGFDSTARGERKTYALLS